MRAHSFSLLCCQVVLANGELEKHVAQIGNRQKTGSLSEVCTALSEESEKIGTPPSVLNEKCKEMPEFTTKQDVYADCMKLGATPKDEKWYTADWIPTVEGQKEPGNHYVCAGVQECFSSATSQKKFSSPDEVCKALVSGIDIKPKIFSDAEARENCKKAIQNPGVPHTTAQTVSVPQSEKEVSVSESDTEACALALAVEDDVEAYKNPGCKQFTTCDSLDVKSCLARMGKPTEFENIQIIGDDGKPTNVAGWAGLSSYLA